MNNPDSEKNGIAELIIGKNRHGPVGSIELAYQAEFVSFYDLVWAFNLNSTHFRHHSFLSCTNPIKSK